MCICVNGTVGNGTWCDTDSSVREDVSKSQRVGRTGEDLSETINCFLSDDIVFSFDFKIQDVLLISPDILIVTTPYGSFFSSDFK